VVGLQRVLWGGSQNPHPNAAKSAALEWGTRLVRVGSERRIQSPHLFLPRARKEGWDTPSPKEVPGWSFGEAVGG
jgi:hypothetical protein